MEDLPGNLLQIGGTSAGFGVIAYLLLKLLERYSGSEAYYQGRITSLEKERDDEKEKRIEAEKEAARCQAENKTLKSQLAQERRTRKKR